MYFGGGGADTSKPTIAAEHRMMRKARPTAPQGPGPEPGNWFADTVQTRCFAVDLRDLTKCLKSLVPQTGLEPVTPSLRMT